MNVLIIRIVGMRSQVLLRLAMLCEKYGGDKRIVDFIK